jgi:tripartite-type tricarboxylate transporter receptor subunit TctC
VLDRRAHGAARAHDGSPVLPFIRVEFSMIDASRRQALSALAAIGASGLAPAAIADTYPSKPVRVIVPFPPGGGTDTVTRIVAPALGEVLGTQILVDNRGGAQGISGTQLAARANGDGYTLVIAEIGATAVAPAMQDKLPFDVARDFVPIGMLIQQPYLMSIHPSVPAQNLAEFIKLAQANPGKFNFGSGNATAHVAQEVFFATAGLKLTHIPYRGSGPSMAALLANEVQVIFSGPGAALGQIKAGKIRPLAVTTARRSSEVPEVPSLSELGFKGFEIIGWYGLMAPAGTPRPVVQKVSAALERILSGGPTAQALRTRGYEPVVMGPEAFGKFMRAETARWAKAVRQYNVKSSD